MPVMVARKIIIKNHYLHSLPGCTKLCFGVFSENRLMGAITFGSGPANAFRLVEGVAIDECLTLTRLWLSNELPPNSESRAIAVSLRYLKRYTRLKFLVSYADPARFRSKLLFPATKWGMLKPDRLDVWGFLLAVAIALAIVGVLFLLSWTRWP